MPKLLEGMTRKDLEEMAEFAVRFYIPRRGWEGIKEKERGAIDLAIKQGLISQEAVNLAETHHDILLAREALLAVRSVGKNRLDEEQRKALQYGLDNGLYTRETVDEVHGHYLANRARKHR